MKFKVALVFLFCFIIQSYAADKITTKQKGKFQGKIIKVTKKGFVLQRGDRSLILIPKQDVAEIVRGNTLLDFENGMRYHIEKKRPFLPFIVLSLATGVYAVDKFQSYQDKKKQSEATTRPKHLFV